MKNAIHLAIFFLMLVGVACFCPLSIAAASACENAYFSPDDFNHEHPLPKPHAEFMKSYKLAKAGNAIEQRNVAVSYDAGYLVTACPERAYYWYRKAARNGDKIAQDWIARNDLFRAMLDGPESVGLIRPQISSVTVSAEGDSSQRSDITDSQAEKLESLAAEAGDAKSGNNQKVATAKLERIQAEPAQPRIRDREGVYNTEGTLTPSQEVKAGDETLQDRHLTPIAPTPAAGFQAVPAGGATDETSSHLTNAANSQEVDYSHSAESKSARKAPDKSPINTDQVAGAELNSAGQEADDTSSAVSAINADIGRWLISANSLTNVPLLPSSSEVLDISLEHAINIAKETSFRLGRSQRNIDGTLARYKSASSLYLPRFDSSLYATQSNHKTPYIGPGMTPQLGANLNLGITLPLDIGGVIGRQVTQAELAQRAAEYDLAQSHLDVTLEVEINYFNALRAQETVRVDQQIVDEMERLAREVGETSGGVSNFIQVELANARQTLTSSRTVLDLSFDTLKQSLRLPPGTAVRLTDKFRHSSVVLDGVQALREALDNRPDIGQVGVRIAQTQLAAEQVSDVRKPTLNLQLFSNNSYYSRIPGSIYDNPLIYDRGVMATFNLPIAYYDWGYLSETKRAALLQNEQARVDLQEQRERVGLEVRQAVIALKRAEQRISTLPDLALAHNALRRAESDFLSEAKRADPATLAQMSNARASSRLAETVTIDALYEYNIAIFNLEHAIGTPPRDGVADAKSATSIKDQGS